MCLRLLIVDDSSHFLDAARAVLEGEGMTIAGVASTAADAVRRIDELRPDVVLVDVDLGSESGLDLARLVAERRGASRPPTILISACPEEDLVDLIAASPAVGFVAKRDLSRRRILDVLARAGGPTPV